MQRTRFFSGRVPAAVLGLALAFLIGSSLNAQTNGTAGGAAAPGWLRIDGRQLTSNGAPVQLRGIGLGNWMLIESFMLGLPQMDYVMRDTFAEVLGPEKAGAFWNAYMDSYFTAADFAKIKAMGFNHVRLPFSYRHFESDSAPGQWDERGFQLVDRIVGLCRQHGLWVMLDLHSAPGCQAADWNAESANGEILLWDNLRDQERVAALWGEIARRYQHEPAVMAYEILNEPDTQRPSQAASLNAFNHRCIQAIRAVDKQHVIVIDGDKHATDLRVVDAETFADPQVMGAFHFYHQYTPPLREVPAFPCVYEGQTIDDDFLINKTGLHKLPVRDRIARPAYLDEFGIHYGGKGAEAQRQIIQAIIAWCEREKINWCLWHWKDVNGMGLWHLRPGTPWLQWLERSGARRLREQSEAAVRAYTGQVNSFLPLDAKDRTWLSRETQRDLERLTLRKIVEQMKSLSTDELAALGRSFSGENFEIDASMAAGLERLMRTNAGPASVGEPQRAGAK
jgi:hypothetical protein